MLTVSDLSAGYLGAAVVSDINLSVASGEVFCLLGANGAGKSTIAKAMVGLLAARTGRIVIDGVDVTRQRAYDRLASGLAIVPESRHLFPGMTVADNLLLGGYTRGKADREREKAGVLELFPQLARLLGRRAGDLSGGEQQMLAIGRALMASPRYLILDEPSLGLAPIIVELILNRVRRLAASGLGVLLIEQNVDKALRVSDRAAVLENGRFSMSGPAAEIRDDPRVITSYLGVAL